MKMFVRILLGALLAAALPLSSRAQMKAGVISDIGVVGTPMSPAGSATGFEPLVLTPLAATMLTPSVVPNIVPTALAAQKTLAASVGDEIKPGQALRSLARAQEVTPLHARTPRHVDHALQATELLKKRIITQKTASLTGEDESKGADAETSTQEGAAFFDGATAKEDAEDAVVPQTPDEATIQAPVKRTKEFKRRQRESMKSRLQEIVSPTAVKKAVILGGGPAGMMTALNMLKHGVSVTIVEQRTDYDRPIHFNVRQSFLDQIAHFDPKLVPLIMDKLGVIDRVEFVDATLGKKLKNPPAGIRKPNGKTRIAGGREMMESPSVGQIKVDDLEQILYSHLRNIQGRDERQNREPRVRFLRGYQAELEELITGDWKVTVFRVQANKKPDGRTERVRATEGVDLGVPDLVVVAEGAGSETRKNLPVKVTATSPETRFIAGYVGLKSGGLIRRRYDALTDKKTGESYGVRQIAVGHSKKEHTWTLVEVPESVSFKDRGQIMRYYLRQAAKVLEVPLKVLKTLPIAWGPNLFRLQQWVVDTAVVGKNVILIGDAVGNAHFLTSGGVMTASVPHQHALERLLMDIAGGYPGGESAAFHRYNKWVIASTLEWTRLGIREFGKQVAAVNFGQQFTQLLQDLRKENGLSDGDAVEAKASFLNVTETEKLLEGHPQGEVKWNDPVAGKSL